MRERRWPWMVTSALLLAAACAAAWSTYVYWLPCRGTLFSGSLVRGYRYGSDFSDACLRRMDEGMPFLYPSELSEQTPAAWELGVAAMTLAGVAWLVLVLGMRWSLRTKAVAVLPGLATLTLAAADGNVSGGLLVAPEAAAGVALLAISSWEPEVDRRYFLRVLVVAWGTTAFGFVHLIGEFILMIALSDANWDSPPLTGSVTVVTLLVSAVLTLVLTLRRTPAERMKEEQSHDAAPSQRTFVRGEPGRGRGSTPTRWPRPAGSCTGGANTTG